MSCNIPQPVEFGFFFTLLKNLWIICRDFEQGAYNLDQLKYLQYKHFDLLSKDCKYFGWDEAELYYAFGAIELNDELLNPFPFETNQFAYIIHIPNCYLIS